MRRKAKHYTLEFKQKAVESANEVYEWLIKGLNSVGFF